MTVSHICCVCNCKLPLSEFNPRSTRGWVDSEGVRRASQCARCMREASRHDRALAKFRAQGNLIAGRAQMPAEPFRQWLVERERYYRAMYPERVTKREHALPQGFAEYVGVASRRLWALLYGENGKAQHVVGLDLVERALLHEGSTDLWEVYPHLYPEEEAVAV